MKPRLTTSGTKLGLGEGRARRLPEYGRRVRAGQELA